MPTKAIIIPELTSKDVERFWSNVDKNGSIPEAYPWLGNCWIWQGPRIRNGYGYFWVQGHEVGAHRVALSLQLGRSVDPELEALHICDVRLCQRHLREDSHAENQKEAGEKGRMVSGKRHPSYLRPEVVPKGEEHYAAKLTEEIVLSAREEYRTGTVTVRMLGYRYGVAPQVMHEAICGKTWKYLSGAVIHSGGKKVREPRGPYKKKSPTAIETIGG